MRKQPLTMHKTITGSKEWEAWKDVNNFPLSPFADAINDTEKTDFFTPKHWRAFSKFIGLAQANKYKKLKVKINEYYKEKNAT